MAYNTRNNKCHRRSKPLLSTLVHKNEHITPQTDWSLNLLNKWKSLAFEFEDEIDQLNQDNDTLQQKNYILQKDNDRLQKDNDRLQKDNDRLQKVVSICYKWKNMASEFEKDINENDNKFDSLLEENRKLRKELSMLKSK